MTGRIQHLPTQERALLDLLCLVDRFLRESLSGHPPHGPLHTNGHDSALVDAQDLTALGAAYRRYEATLSEPAGGRAP